MRKLFSVIVVAVAILSFIVWDVSENKKSETSAVAPLHNADQSSLEELHSEITLDNGSGKSFNVPLSSIPDLANYLEEATDSQIELGRMQVEHLDWTSTSDHYFLMKYGCGNKICRLVLIQLTDRNEMKTTYLTEGIFAGAEVFDEKAMIRIAVNEGSAVSKHQLILVDFNRMAILHPIDKNDEENYFSAPLYPILEYKWLTEDTVELVVADLPDTTYESIEKWYIATNPPVKNVEIKIEVNL